MERGELPVTGDTQAGAICSLESPGAGAMLTKYLVGPFAARCCDPAKPGRVGWGLRPRFSTPGSLQSHQDGL